MATRSPARPDRVQGVGSYCRRNSRACERPRMASGHSAEPHILRVGSSRAIPRPAPPASEQAHRAAHVALRNQPQEPPWGRSGHCDGTDLCQSANRDDDQRARGGVHPQAPRGYRDNGFGSGAPQGTLRAFQETGRLWADQRRSAPRARRTAHESSHDSKRLREQSFRLAPGARCGHGGATRTTRSSGRRNHGSCTSHDGEGRPGCTPAVPATRSSGVLHTTSRRKSPPLPGGGHRTNARSRRQSKQSHDRRPVHRNHKNVVRACAAGGGAASTGSPRHATRRRQESSRSDDPAPGSTDETSTADPGTGT